MKVCGGGGGNDKTHPDVSRAQVAPCVAVCNRAAAGQREGKEGGTRATHQRDQEGLYFSMGVELVLDWTQFERSSSNRRGA